MPTTMHPQAKWKVRLNNLVFLEADDRNDYLEGCTLGEFLGPTHSQYWRDELGTDDVARIDACMMALEKGDDQCRRLQKIQPHRSGYIYQQHLAGTAALVTEIQTILAQYGYSFV